LDATEPDDTDPELFRTTCNRRRTKKANPINPATATIIVEATMLEWRFVSEERLSLDPTTAETLLLVGLDVGALDEITSEDETGLAEGLLEEVMTLIAVSGEEFVLWLDDDIEEGSADFVDG
jgi:hypothetical protein